MDFIGRHQELASLEALFNKKNASLVILTGRRRIGKSRLVAEFAQKYHFIHLSGVAPTVSTTAQSQREHFANQLKLPNATKYNNWQDLFLSLANNLPKNKKTVILLDEISWMGASDPDFLGLLKNAWDHYFSLKNQLIIILCGSVSAWIEKEIINGTAFLGRPSLYINLQELKLEELKLLWHKSNYSHFSTYEKLKILAITGGIPRYLELLNLKEPADYNIKQLCFTPNSPLLNEYNRIFSDIFGERSVIYKKIIDSILNGSKQQQHILNYLKRSKGGTISQYLNDLIAAGFIQKDQSWNLINGQYNKQCSYRLKDNFIRFNLKFIEPNLTRIQSGLILHESLTNLSGWYSTLGLQFENLVINNIQAILPLLNIQPQEVVNFGPYLQTKNQTYHGCQIDLLIQTKAKILFICEIKFSTNLIPSEIIQEVQTKIKHLKKPKGMSFLPVLIHVNGVSDQVLDSQYFYRIIDFGSMI